MFVNCLYCQTKAMFDKSQLFLLAQTLPRRYDVEKLTGRNDLVNDFKVKLGGAFAQLLDLDPQDVETMYDGFKEATNSATERTAGFK